MAYKVILTYKIYTTISYPLELNAECNPLNEGLQLRLWI